jgi:hypothetical protein
MPSDPSWDIMPVVSPALRERKRRRLIRSSCAYDPVGLAEPLYQLRHRDQVVMPSALDRVSRELLIRAQAAISSALDSVTDDALESPDIVTKYTLRWHEWQIAIALRDITNLRAEHEFNAAASAGPMTNSVLAPLRTRSSPGSPRWSATQLRYSRPGPRSRTGRTRSGYRT